MNFFLSARFCSLHNGAQTASFKGGDENSNGIIDVTVTKPTEDEVILGRDQRIRFPAMSGFVIDAGKLCSSIC